MLSHYLCTCSVAKLSSTLCDPMDCSTPGFPVLNHLSESAQTHILWVCDAIQASHPLLSPSPFAFNVSQHWGFFPMSQLLTSGGQSIGASTSASVLPMNIQGWFLSGLTGLISLQSKGLSRVFSSTTIQSRSVQSFSCVWLFPTSWTAAHQASLSITNSWNLLKLMSIESKMPSNHLILCHPLFLLPSIFLCIGVFSKESVLLIRWPKYWSFSFSILPMDIQDWFPLGLTG